MSLLKKGDVVGLIAPSAALGDFNLHLIQEMFSQFGLQTKSAENIKDSFRYMAGTDERRAEAVNQMIRDTQIKALFCMRGGAGATRILDKVDFVALRKNPKPIIGLSDSTALQNAALKLSDNISLSGFLPLYDTKDGKINDFMRAELEKALFEDEHKIVSGCCLREGQAEGKMVGGCLSVLSWLCGTKYFPSLKDNILLVEDVGEKTYKIDLMLNQLKQQPDFDKLKGIVIGQFSDCIIKDANDGTVEDCINDFVKDVSVPVVTDFAYGHIPNRYILPLGMKVKMVADKQYCNVVW